MSIPVPPDGREQGRPDLPGAAGFAVLPLKRAVPPHRPRVLIIVENDVIPGDRRVWQEAVSLRGGGWDVTLLAPNRRPGEPRRATDEVIDGVSVHRFELRFAEESRWGHVGEYATAMWRIWREVQQLGRDRPFDVIEACNPPDFLLLAALGQRRRGARLILDHHDLVPELYACRAGGSKLVACALQACERLGFALADVALVTNDSIRRVATQRDHQAPGDVFVVRNGPVLERFRPVARDPALARGREHLLVYVGLIGPQDGVDHALWALSHLLERRQDWHAAFLGDGEMVPELRKLTSQLGLDEHVEFYGLASETEVRRAICSADVCLAPDPKNSYTDSATLVKIAEYMALSRPTVSFDLTESRATAGDAAVYAGNNDPLEFATRIAELLDDPERCRQLGEVGRARVESGLAWEYSERTLLEAYDSAVEKRATHDRPRVSAAEPADLRRSQRGSALCALMLELWQRQFVDHDGALAQRLAEGAGLAGSRAARLAGSPDGRVTRTVCAVAAAGGGYVRRTARAGEA